MDNKSVEVIVDELESNPHCFHGPTLLFKRFRGKTKEYYACSASRNRKECSFYLPKTQTPAKRDFDNHWKLKQDNTLLSISKSKPYKKYLKILNSLKNEILVNCNTEENTSKIYKKITSTNSRWTYTELQPSYCYTCNCLFDNSDSGNHSECNTLPNLTYYQLTHPTEVIIPKVDSKNHAQFFFSKTTVQDIIALLSKMHVTKILCVGTPRIHEFVTNEYKNEIDSLLLDFDRNYYNFYSKKKFIWFNMFNNYMFNSKQKQILDEFLNSGEIVILMDPPFGGRVEPLAYTLHMLNKLFLKVNNLADNKGKFSYNNIKLFERLKILNPALKKDSHRTNRIQFLLRKFVVNEYH